MTAMRPVVLIHIILFVFFSAVPSGCLPPLNPDGMPLLDEGSVFLYLQPLPSEAQRISFELTGVAAVREQGDAVPCRLHLRFVAAGSLQRQRFLASCRLEPGTYAGFELGVDKASMRTRDGDAVLPVAGKSHLSMPFLVARGRAQAVFLRMNAPGTAGGAGFAPSFSREMPNRPTALNGYVANSGSHTITVFDKKQGQVIDVLATGERPRGLALDPVRGILYVALEGEDAVQAIDVASREELARIRLQSGDRPARLALLADGRTLLAANAGSDTLSFLDAVSFLERDRVDVGSGPEDVLIDAGGTKAYVLNSMASSLSIVDIPNRSPAGSLAAEAGPFQAAFNRAGGRIYVVSLQSPYLSVIDLTGRSAMKRVFVGGEPGAVKVDTASDRVFVARRRGIGIDVFDPISFFPVDTIMTSGGVAFMAIDGEEGNLYLLDPARELLTAVNLNSKAVRFEIDTGERPSAVAVTRGR